MYARISRQSISLIYHCDEARLFDYGEAQASYQYTTGFDLLLVRKKEREELKACMERPAINYTNNLSDFTPI